MHRITSKESCVPKILAIDDDRTVLRLIERALADTHLEVVTFTSAEQGLAVLMELDVAVCLLDIMLPDMNGLELAKKIRALDARLPIIFITSLDDSGTAIEAMKLGAYEYCSKPLDVQHVQDLVEKALESRRLMQSPVVFPQSDSKPASEGEHLVGSSPSIFEVYKQIGRVAAQQVPVLIRGESGTGKELIARANIAASPVRVTDVLFTEILVQ
jgi:two-component system nitrogen regulation response regulator GlnG